MRLERRSRSKWMLTRASQAPCGSGAIFVSDFQDQCYDDLIFQNDREGGRKRGEHGLLDGPSGGENSGELASGRLSPESGDNPLINLDFRKENGFGFRSIQLGFPSAWAWISFSPVWISFSPAWNSFPAGWEARPRRRLRSWERRDSVRDRERAPGIVRLGGYLAIWIRPQALARRPKRSTPLVRRSPRFPAPALGRER